MEDHFNPVLMNGSPAPSTIEKVRFTPALCAAITPKVLGFNHFTKQAAVHILIVEEKVNLTSGIGGWVKNKSFAPIDIGIAAAHICLAAEDEGLGSCILGWFDENKMRELLSIPSNKRVVLDIVLGYSTQADRPKKRKPWDEVVSFNSY